MPYPFISITVYSFEWLKRLMESNAPPFMTQMIRNIKLDYELCTWVLAESTTFDTNSPPYYPGYDPLIISLGLTHQFFHQNFQGTRVSEDKEFCRDYVHTRYVAGGPCTVSVDIQSYQGTLKKPQWADIEPGVHYLLPSFIAIYWWDQRCSLPFVLWQQSCQRWHRRRWQNARKLEAINRNSVLFFCSGWQSSKRTLVGWKMYALCTLHCRFCTDRFLPRVRNSSKGNFFPTISSIPLTSKYTEVRLKWYTIWSDGTKVIHCIHCSSCFIFKHKPRCYIGLSCFTQIFSFNRAPKNIQILKLDWDKDGAENQDGKGRPAAESYTDSTSLLCNFQRSRHDHFFQSRSVTYRLRNQDMMFLLLWEQKECITFPSNQLVYQYRG